MYKNNILGQRIKSLRKEHKYTQEDVAKKFMLNTKELFKQKRNSNVCKGYILFIPT